MSRYDKLRAIQKNVESKIKDDDFDELFDLTTSAMQVTLWPLLKNAIRAKADAEGTGNTHLRMIAQFAADEFFNELLNNFIDYFYSDSR